MRLTSFWCIGFQETHRVDHVVLRELDGTLHGGWHGHQRSEVDDRVVAGEPALEVGLIT